jgi:hypothetical protein
MQEIQNRETHRKLSANRTDKVNTEITLKDFALDSSNLQAKDKKSIKNEQKL